MPDPGEQRNPVGFEPAEQRRERIAAQVRRWCEQCRIDGRHAPLSDEAALALAAGHLDEPTRAVFTARRLAGRSYPPLGGYGELRRLTDEHARLVARAAAQRPGAARVVAEYRASELAKKLRAARYGLVHSPAHYAQGVRAVRRQRRDGIHLDLEQREALFAALQRTPAPIPVPTIEQARGTVLSIVGDRVARWSERTPAAEAGRRAAEVLARQVPGEDDHFTDRYDTLLFLAGSLYDRVQSSSAWRSEYLSVQRAQLDLAEELTQISVDTVALRGLLTELNDAIRSVPAARAGLAARVAALGPVWDQLLARVAALARIGDLLGSAEGRLHMMRIAERTASLDIRIDDLIGRSGTRELSAENTNFVGDQFGDAAGLIGSLQSALHGDIAELTTKD
ncbi:hypothetical protein [Rhodococcus chondri]|uniref:Uncharacterized protein n=1 Tax=Rhodococcus chondri TaxID=3065941 RepID=A0ABU7JN93_9NOCA|nr:hypothetical protein [Rhodococcus sp. CC-R104]MEE2031359.1 hypothetical protein [Rhodococcus sp. CC-R104]